MQKYFINNDIIKKKIIKNIKLIVYDKKIKYTIKKY